MGATTGIVGATVVTLGLLTLPTLLRRGYDKGLACGTICASGTLGQIIPPSLILILLADIMNESVGTLFAAAMLPGLMLAGITWSIFSAWYPAPADGAGGSREERDLISRKELAGKLLRVVLPPVALVVAVLGSIIGGVAARPRPRRWARSARSWSPRSAGACRGRFLTETFRRPPASPR